MTHVHHVVHFELARLAEGEVQDHGARADGALVVLAVVFLRSDIGDIVADGERGTERGADGMVWYGVGAGTLVAARPPPSTVLFPRPLLVPVRRATSARSVGLRSLRRARVVVRRATAVLSPECKRRDSSVADMLHISAGVAAIAREMV